MVSDESLACAVSTSSISSWMQEIGVRDATLAGVPVQISGVCGDVLTRSEGNSLRIYRRPSGLLKRLFKSNSESTFWSVSADGKHYRDFHCVKLDIALFPSGEVFTVTLLASDHDRLVREAPSVASRVIVFLAESGSAQFSIGYFALDSETFFKFTSPLCYSLGFDNDAMLNRAFSESIDLVDQFNFYVDELESFALYGFSADHPSAKSLKALALPLTKMRLREAIEAEDVLAVRTVLSYWKPRLLAAPMAEVGEKPFLYDAAFYSRRGDVVGDLLSSGEDPALSFRGVLPIHFAAMRGNEQAVENLIRAGSPIDAHIEKVSSTDNECCCATPLHLAAINGCGESVQALLDSGASVTEKTLHGETALHWAVGPSHEIVSFLVEIGANLAVRNHAGSSALHLACGATVCDRPRWGVASFSPFETCVGRFFPDTNLLIKLLLSSGLDANSRDVLNKTPLHYAAYHGSADAAKALLHASVDVDCIDAQGFSPLDLAVLRVNVDVCQILLDAGASRLSIPAGFDNFASFLETKVNVKNCRELFNLLVRCGIESKSNSTSLLNALDTADANRLKIHWDSDFGMHRKLLADPSITISRNLLDHGAVLESFDDLGNTPLLVAAGAGVRTLRSAKYRFYEVYSRHEN